LPRPNRKSSKSCASLVSGFSGGQSSVQFRRYFLIYIGISFTRKFLELHSNTQCMPLTEAWTRTSLTGRCGRIVTVSHENRGMSGVCSPDAHSNKRRTTSCRSGSFCAVSVSSGGTEFPTTEGWCAHRDACVSGIHSKPSETRRIPCTCPDGEALTCRCPAGGSRTALRPAARTETGFAHGIEIRLRLALSFGQ